MDKLDEKCENCVWHYDCTCVVCEDGFTVICSVHNKHVSKKDTCERFAEI